MKHIINGRTMLIRNTYCIESDFCHYWCWFGTNSVAPKLSQGSLEDKNFTFPNLRSKKKIISLVSKNFSIGIVITRNLSKRPVVVTCGSVAPGLETPVYDTFDDNKSACVYVYAISIYYESI